MQPLSTDAIDQVIHELVELNKWVMREFGRPLGLDGMERAAITMLEQMGITKEQHMVDYLVIAAITTHDFVRVNSVLHRPVA